jgi:hypothetical protein
LNPNINRFIGANNYVGAAANIALQVDPLTGNRYMYAGANPAGMIDDGHSPMSPCWGPFRWGCKSEPAKPLKHAEDLKPSSEAGATADPQCDVAPSGNCPRREKGTTRRWGDFAGMLASLLIIMGQLDSRTGD